MLRQRFSALLLTIIGSAAALLAADQLFFRLGTFNGCLLVPSYADERDLGWWRSHVGKTPDNVDDIRQPDAISGRAGTWWHPSGGPGAAGATGSPFEAEFGVAAFSLQCDSDVVRGRALATNEQWAYHIGVALPFVMLERSYVGPAGTDPGHPVMGGWTTRFRFGFFLLDMLLWLIVIDIVGVWLGRLRRLNRSLRGRCQQCGYILLATQTHCPECGGQNQNRSTSKMADTTP